jgi:hypothetical protein
MGMTTTLLQAWIVTNALLRWPAMRERHGQISASGICFGPTHLNELPERF